MKPKQYILVSAFTFAFCLLSGVWLTNISWDGKVFVYLGEERAPAAVRSLSDYSAIEMKSLDASAHLQLMNNSVVVAERDRLGIQLGHPLLHREDGARVFGCEVRDHTGVYNRISLLFVAEGVSSSAAPPQMTVVSECHSMQDLNQLETIWIPMQQIYSLPARDQEFTSNDDNPVGIGFTDMPPEWPDRWVLMSVRLFRDDNPDQSLTIDTNHLRDARPTLLSLDWQRQ
jgi:hypothetical protein